MFVKPLQFFYVCDFFEYASKKVMADQITVGWISPPLRAGIMVVKYDGRQVKEAFRSCVDYA